MQLFCVVGSLPYCLWEHANFDFVWSILPALETLWARSLIFPSLPQSFHVTEWPIISLALSQSNKQTLTLSYQHQIACCIGAIAVTLYVLVRILPIFIFHNHCCQILVKRWKTNLTANNIITIINQKHLWLGLGFVGWVWGLYHTLCM